MIRSQEAGFTSIDEFAPSARALSVLKKLPPKAGQFCGEPPNAKLTMSRKSLWKKVAEKSYAVGCEELIDSGVDRVALLWLELRAAVGGENLGLLDPLAVGRAESRGAPKAVAISQRRTKRRREARIACRRSRWLPRGLPRWS